MSLFTRLIIFFIFNFSFSQKIEEKVNLDYNTNIFIYGNSNLEVEVALYFNKPLDSVELIINDNFFKNFKILNSNLTLSSSLDKYLRKKILIKSIDNNKINKISFKNNIKVTDSIKSRFLNFDKNQFYLLPDSHFFPDVNIFRSTVINYKTIIKTDKHYSYLEKDLDNNTTPQIIAGNFEIQNLNGVNSFIPKDININNERLSLLTKVVNSSLLYFSKIYGKPKRDENFNVFFLKRTGGYAHNSGIILDQNYLDINTKLTSSLKLLIAHEVAHYWWGVNIKTFHSSLFEGLSEYSALLFMEDEEDFKIKKFYEDKNMQLELNPIDKIKFDTITTYASKNNLYRHFSYLKLPIILKEIEYKIGKEKFINNLKELFEEYSLSNEKVSYNDFINYFSKYDLEEELKNEFFGIKNEWTDFYIKDVTDNIVTYGVEGLNNEECILVELTDLNDVVFYDTISFYKSDMIEKKYNFYIKRIVIDPDFQNNQKTMLNDVFDIRKVYLSNSKYGKIYNNEFYNFSDKIVDFLFYGNLDINSFVIDENLKNKLIEIAASTRKIKTHGFFMSVDKNNYIIKIKVIFSGSLKQNLIGYLQFSYFVKDNLIYLNTIDKIKL